MQEIYLLIVITVINACRSNPCHNYATCVNGNNTFTCKCKGGYGGLFCSNGMEIWLIFMMIISIFRCWFCFRKWLNCLIREKTAFVREPNYVDIIYDCSCIQLHFFKLTHWSRSVDLRLNGSRFWLMDCSITVDRSIDRWLLSGR